MPIEAVAALAFLLLWTGIPETLPERSKPDSDPSLQPLPRRFQLEIK
jgi:hypothetical protein